MSFWNLVGIAAVINTLFGKKSYPVENNPISYDPPHPRPTYHPKRWDIMDSRHKRLSARISEIEQKLRFIYPTDPRYHDLKDELEYLRDEMDFLEDERSEADDDDF